MKNFAPIREWLFPTGCALCGAAPLSTSEARSGLCKDCASALTPDRSPRCPRCARPLLSAQGRCIPCREAEAQGERSLLHGVFAAFPYTGPYRRLLRAYKYGAARNLGPFFAETLLRLLPPLPSTGAAGFSLVPVPPRAGKLRACGWDQVEHLAVLLEKRRPLRRCLQRLPSLSQKELGGEERKGNLLGNIRCMGEAPREAVIFDDIITTGATLEACAAALRAGGSQRVYGICLFYD